MYKSIQIFPLYILDDGVFTNLVCKLVCDRDRGRPHEIIRYYTCEDTYDEIIADVAGEFGVGAISCQQVWFLPTYSPREVLPF